MKFNFLPIVLFLFLLLFLATNCATTSNAASTAGWPRHVPTLIGRWEADQIAWVEVVEADRVDGEQVSRLKVLQVIKSDDQPPQAEIKVYIPLGSHWPYTFTAGNQAIAFLGYDKKQKRYEDFDSSAGIDVNVKTAKLLISQYAKLPEILKESDPKKLLQKKVDWYFGFVSNPPSLYELRNGIRSLWREAKKKKLLTKEQRASASSLLSTEQKQKICEMLAAHEPTVELHELVDLCRSHPSVEIDDFLVKSLKLCLDEDRKDTLEGMAMADQAIELLPKRLKFAIPPDLKMRLDEILDRRVEYAYTISISDDFTDNEKEEIKKGIARTWREIVKTFLEIEALNGT